jgi:hypothetical protein
MSESHPTELLLAPVDTRPDAIASRLAPLLKTRYFLDPDDALLSTLSFDAGTDDWLVTALPHGSPKKLADVMARSPWVEIAGSMLLSGQDIPTDVDLHAVSPQDGRTCVRVRLGSRAYEAAFRFDTLRGRLDRKFKRHLLDFCVDVASAVGTDAFVLRYASGFVRPLNLESLMQGVHKQAGNVGNESLGLITGVRNSLISRQELETLWGKRKVEELREPFLLIDRLL